MNIFRLQLVGISLWSLIFFNVALADQLTSSAGEPHSQLYISDQEMRQIIALRIRLQAASGPTQMTGEEAELIHRFSTRAFSGLNIDLEFLDGKVIYPAYERFLVQQARTAARSMPHYLTNDDFKQAAYLGLIAALSSFTPDFPHAFNTLLYSRVKDAFYTLIGESTPILPSSHNQLKAQGRVSEREKLLSHLLGRMPTRKELFEAFMKSDAAENRETSEIRFEIARINRTVLPFISVGDARIESETHYLPVEAREQQSESPLSDTERLREFELLKATLERMDPSYALILKLSFGIRVINDPPFIRPGYREFTLLEIAPIFYEFRKRNSMLDSQEKIRHETSMAQLRKKALADAKKIYISLSSSASPLERAQRWQDHMKPRASGNRCSTLGK